MAKKMYAFDWTVSFDLPGVIETELTLEQLRAKLEGLSEADRVEFLGEEISEAWTQNGLKLRDGEITVLLDSLQEEDVPEQGTRQYDVHFSTSEVPDAMIVRVETAPLAQFGNLSGEELCKLFHNIVKKQHPWITYLDDSLYVEEVNMVEAK